MTKEELINIVAGNTATSSEDVAKILDSCTFEIKKHLSKGEKVALSGFGTFVLSKRKAKIFKNPKTGEMQNLPERTFPHFRSGEVFKKNFMLD